MEDMLTALDDLAAEFNTLAEIEVPRQFSAIENLADEAGGNMSPAASLDPGAHAGGENQENVDRADAAQ